MRISVLASIISASQSILGWLFLRLEFRAEVVVLTGSTRELLSINRSLPTHSTVQNT